MKKEEKVIQKMQVRHGKFLLNAPFVLSMKETSEYCHGTTNISTKGWISINAIGDKRYKIYHPAVYYIFAIKELEVYDLINKKYVVIGGINFFDSYKEGYNEGIIFFKEKFKPPSSLYTEKAQTYIKNLNYHYYCTFLNNANDTKGWGYVKRSCSTVLTSETISEFGYYSGIISELDKLIEAHPALFEDFYKIESKIDVEL